MKLGQLLVTAALLILCALPVSAQEPRPSVPDIVERVALSLVDDGVFKVNRTGTVCDGSRDAELCDEFDGYLEELLKIGEGRVNPAAYQLPFYRQPSVRVKEIGEGLKKLLPRVKGEKAREAIAEAARQLKVL